MRQKIVTIIGIFILPGILLSWLWFINPVAATPSATLSVCPPADGCDYSTIAAALAVASDGDTIAVQSGNYTETLVIDHSLTIRGDSPQITIVDGNGGGAVFAIVPTATVTIENLTLQNGYNDNGGGGIYNEGTLTVTNSIIKNNEAKSEEGGGGILNETGATMVMTATIVTGNQATFGAGIFNGGVLTIENSAVTQNTTKGPSPETGGGIENDGILILRNSEVSGNVVGGILEGDDGGGIENAGILEISNSVIYDNVASAGVGGGIDNITTGQATIISSTIRDNSGGAGGGINNEGTLWLSHSLVYTNTATNTDFAFSIGGGGIRNNAAGAITVTNSTVGGNLAYEGGGGGLLNRTISATVLLRSSTFYHNLGSSIYNLTGTVTLSNTLIGDNLTGGSDFNCGGHTTGIVSDGSNLDSGTSCGLGIGDLIETNPMLGPLQDNGGPTLTHALEVDSPAVDVTTVCEATDQRGVPRPVGIACDIGAYETGTYKIFLPAIISQ